MLTAPLRSDTGGVGEPTACRFQVGAGVNEVVDGRINVGPFYQAEWITASGTTIIFPSALRSSSSATAPRTSESGKIRWISGLNSPRRSWLMRATRSCRARPVRAEDVELASPDVAQVGLGQEAGARSAGDQPSAAPQSSD